MDKKTRNEVAEGQEPDKVQEVQVQVFQEDKWDYDYYKRKRPLKIWQAILVVCLCMLVIPIVMVVPLTFVAAVMKDPNVLLVENAVIISLVSFAVMLAVAAIIYRKTKESQKMEKISPAKWAAILLLTYIVGDAVSRLLSLLPLEDMYEVYVEIMETGLSGNPVVVFITLVLVGPLAEEVIFRGILYSSFRGRYGVWTSVILSALIFAVAHANIFQALGVFATGAILCLAYEKFNNLTVPFVMHAFNNSMAFLGMEFLWDVNSVLFTALIIGEIIVSVIIIKWVLLKKSQENI